MKYRYDIKKECFIREDGLGKKYWINSVEAQRIMTLSELGNSISEIRNKITFNSKKVSESTIENFIRNVRNGNIEIPTDAPVPVYDSLTIEERVSRLEQDLEEFKNKHMKSNGMMDKLRGLWNE